MFDKVVFGLYVSARMIVRQGAYCGHKSLTTTGIQPALTLRNKERVNVDYRHGLPSKIWNHCNTVKANPPLAIQQAPLRSCYHAHFQNLITTVPRRSEAVLF